MSRPPSRLAAQLIPGPGVVAGASLTSSIIAGLNLDPKVKEQILKAFGDLLPGHPVRTGMAAADRSLSPDALTALIPSAAVIGAGFDPAAVNPPVPNALWRVGSQQLLIRVAEVRATLGAGLIEIVVPVTCDQTGDTDISITFLTGTPDRPAGGVMTTEDHPRGAAEVVENWAEPLIAYAWQVLIIATSALSGASGSDGAGRALITASVVATPDGVTVTPMARNAFLAAGAQQ